MKKIVSYAAFLSVFLVASSVFAHDTGIPHEEPQQEGQRGVVETKLVPIKGYGEARVQASTTAVPPRPTVAQDKRMEKREGQAVSSGKASEDAKSGRDGHAILLGLPVVTGNQELNAKLLVLHQDAVKEIEKVRDTYMAKVVALTGTTTSNTGVLRRDDKGSERGLVQRILSGTTTDNVTRILEDKGVQESFLAQIGIQADFLRAVARVFLGAKEVQEVQQ